MGPRVSAIIYRSSCELLLFCNKSRKKEREREMKSAKLKNSTFKCTLYELRAVTFEL